jgi:hypothetical protein
MEEASELTELTDDFTALVHNIFYDENVVDKAAAVNSLADEFAMRIGDGTGDDSQDKELDVPMHTRAVWDTAMINGLPDDCFMYIEAGGAKDEEGKTKPRKLRHFPVKNASGKYDAAHVRNAIARIPQCNAPGLTAAKKRQLQARARKILAQLNKEKEQDSLVERLVARVKSVFVTDEPEPPMMVWKDTTTGQYRWLARYSNNFIDDDNPPEIISRESHVGFIEKVEKGLSKYPELWLWHVPEWKLGQADWLAWDDSGTVVPSGYALAAGHFYKGREAIAEWLTKQDKFAVSHGMSKVSIVRDPSDPRIIVEHETREISPLPATAAANKRTGFYVFTEENQGEKENMAIPGDKRKTLIEKWGLTEAQLEAIEQLNANEAKQADAAQVERKETTETIANAAVVGEQLGTTVPPITRQEIADAVAGALAPLATSIKELQDTVAVMQKDKETAASSGTTVPLLPAASLAALIAQRIIGNPAAAVSAADPLAKSKPKETAPVAAARTGIQFIDEMLAGNP